MNYSSIKYKLLTFLIGLFFIHSASAQVGIGTVTPEGALDLETTSLGLVYPRVALIATNNQSPVINPATGSLEPGTVVYNTSLTSYSNDFNLFPGIYAWDGTYWQPQFIMKEYKKFSQTAVCQRTIIREIYSDPNPNNVDNIDGLTNRTFSPKYSGRYKIEVKTNFGGGKVTDFTGSLDKISVSTIEGAFFFSLFGPGVSIDPTAASYDYSQGWMYTHTYSSRSKTETPVIESFNIPHTQSVIHYKFLQANQTYTFNLSNCIITGNDYFVGNGDTGDGQGHIGHDIPCSVEFTYLGSNE